MKRPTLSPLFDWRSLIAESGLPPSGRLVALTLALHMSSRGDSCFPSLDTLAAETGLSRRSVVYALQRLRKDGYLTVERGGGRGHANRYTATVPTDTPGGYPGKGCNDDTVSACGQPPERVQPATVKGATVAPESVMRASNTSTAEVDDPHKPAPNPIPPPRPLAKLLAAGVSRPTALQLVADHDPAQILQQIAWLPDRDTDRPAGALVSSIRDDWPPPDQPSRRHYPTLDQVALESVEAEQQARSLFADKFSAA